MTYYLAYNPSLGNALAGVSENEITLVEGIVVEARSGEMPNLAKVAWNSAVLDWYDKPVRRLAKLAYMNRFTDSELAKIYDLAKVHTDVEVWLAKFNAATPEADGTAVDLDDLRTQAGVQAFEQLGLLAPGRAAEILG